MRWPLGPAASCWSSVAGGALAPPIVNSGSMSSGTPPSGTGDSGEVVPKGEPSTEAERTRKWLGPEQGGGQRVPPRHATPPMRALGVDRFARAHESLPPARGWVFGAGADVRGVREAGHDVHGARGGQCGITPLLPADDHLRERPTVLQRQWALQATHVSLHVPCRRGESDAPPDGAGPAAFRGARRRLLPWRGQHHDATARLTLRSLRRREPIAGATFARMQRTPSRNVRSMTPPCGPHPSG